MQSCTAISPVFTMSKGKFGFIDVRSFVVHIVIFMDVTLGLSKTIDHKFDAFEMCYSRMLRINWTSHITNVDILHKLGGNTYGKQLEKLKDVFCRPHNENHIRAL